MRRSAAWAAMLARWRRLHRSEHTNTAGEVDTDAVTAISLPQEAQGTTAGGAGARAGVAGAAAAEGALPLAAMAGAPDGPARGAPVVAVVGGAAAPERCGAGATAAGGRAGARDSDAYVRDASTSMAPMPASEEHRHRRKVSKGWESIHKLGKGRWTATTQRRPIHTHATTSPHVLNQHQPSTTAHHPHQASIRNHPTPHAPRVETREPPPHSRTQGGRDARQGPHGSSRILHTPCPLQAQQGRQLAGCHPEPARS